jgi:uncharacterized coiled-coil protein SlyX
MNITLNLAAIGQILAIVTAIGAIWATQHQRRLIAVKEGERNAEMKALQEKIKAQEGTIKGLEDKIHKTDVDLGKMNQKIDMQTEILQEIKDRIDKIAPPTVHPQAREARN